MLLVILCIGAVSASDGNATAETVGDDLQDEALVMGEINEDSHSDDIADDGDNVIVESEKENENVLMAANDDEKLGAWYSTETEIFDNDHQDEVNYVSVGDSANIYNNIKTDGNMYNYLYSKPEVIIYVNGEQVGTMWGYQDNQPVFSSYTYEPYTINFDKEGWWNITAKYNADDYYFAKSDSNTLYYFVGAQAQETVTSIDFKETTKPGHHIKITPKVIRTDDGSEVKEGSVEIYVNDVLNATIDAGTSFDYTNNVEDTYFIYAKYLGTDDFKESTSDSKILLVSDDPSLSPVTVSISLNKTAVGPEEQIDVTPTVLDKHGNEISGTVDIYDENNNLIAKDVQIGTVYSFAHNQEAGTSHAIYAKYLGNEELKYAPGSSAKVNYKVKNVLRINLTANDEESIDIAPSSYGSVSVTFKIDCGDATPEWTLYLNDEEWETYSQGTTSTVISFDSSDLGENVLYAKFAGDEDYLESESNKVYVNVYTSVSVTPSINLNSSAVVEGDKILVTVTASSNAPGNITLYEDSEYTKEIATIPVGESYEYTVPVSDKTTSYYTGYIYAYYNGAVVENTMYTHNPYATGYKTFTVMKQNTAALTGNNETKVRVDVGGSVELYLDIDYWTPTSGYDSNYNTVYYSNIIIYLDDEEFDQFEVERVSSGYSYSYQLVNYTIDFDESDVGKHTIYAYYGGSQTYSSYIAPATSNVIEVTVGALESSLTANDLTMTYKDGSSWEVTLNDDFGNVISDAIVKMGIKGKVYSVKTDADGVAKLPINLIPGTYEVNATFEGNETLKESFVNSTVTVNKGEATLSAVDLTMTYKDGSAWTVSLTDAKGEVISGANVAFGIKGKTYTVKTDDEGVAKLTINLVPGTYDINATLVSPLYDAELVEATVTVNKAAAVLSASDLVMSYKDGSAWAVTLTDANGKAISGTNIAFSVKGATYNIKTDADGVAKLPIGLMIGEYDVSATLNNPNYEADSISNTVTVSDYDAKLVADDINMTYKDGTSYDVQVVDGKGNNISVAYLVVKITIKGTSYNVKTDANGIAKLPINLAPGTYDISAEYNGKEITNTVVVNKA